MYIAVWLHTFVAIYYLAITDAINENSSFRVGYSRLHYILVLLCAIAAGNCKLPELYLLQNVASY